MWRVCSAVPGKKRLSMGVGTAIDGARAELLCGQPKLGSSGSAFSGDGGMMEGRVRSAAVVCLGETVVVVVGTIGVGCMLNP